MKKGFIAFAFAIVAAGLVWLVIRTQDPVIETDKPDSVITHAAQEPASETSVQETATGDHINVTALYLHPTANPAATYSFLDEFDKLTSVFGKPIRTTTLFAETHNGNVTTYKFDNFDIQYFEGRAIHRRIYGSAVSLGIVGKGSIKVGDNISKLQTMFPNSYAFRKGGTISVAIFTPSGEPSDVTLTFDFNNNLITEISTL